MNPSTIEVIAAILFGVAILHTFSASALAKLEERSPRHSGVWHLLSEVEVVFGFWAMILVIAMVFTDGSAAATAYVDSRNFTEPMFVFAIMVIAGKIGRAHV